MNHAGKADKSRTLTIIGIIAMLLMISTKALPSHHIEGYSIFVGLAFFFIIEAVTKTPEAESGLRFTTIPKDLKKPGALFWMLLPIASAVISILLGKLLFNDGYVNHVLGRTDSLLSFDKIPLLIGQLIIGAFGEEIAFRGFFVGKGMKQFPYWICALVSSAAFAAAHFSAGSAGIVIFDLAGIFIDSLIYSTVYRKTGNCVISTIAHLLCNVSGLLITFTFFR